MSPDGTSSWQPADLAALDAALLLVEAREQAEQHQLDGSAWVSDRLGEHLWSKQREIMDSVRDNRYTAVQACHGPGKSRVASRIAAWWIETHPPGSAKVVTTAPTGDQVRIILWSEINDAANVAASRGAPLVGRINETEWKIGKWSAGIGRKPSDHNTHAFQGQHAEFLLVLQRQFMFAVVGDLDGGSDRRAPGVGGVVASSTS